MALLIWVCILQLALHSCFHVFVYLSQFYGISDLFSTVHVYTFLDTMVMMTSVCLVLMELYLLDLLSRYLLCVLSNYSSVSATTTIHRLTQLFTFDYMSW